MKSILKDIAYTALGACIMVPLIPLTTLGLLYLRSAAAKGGVIRDTPRPTTTATSEGTEGGVVTFGSLEAVMEPEPVYAFARSSYDDQFLKGLRISLN